MGSRAQLALGSCEFEANNCVPVTWLALFESDEFLVERRVEEPVQPVRKPIQTPEPRGFRKLLVAIRRILKREIAETGKDRVQPQEFHEPEEYDVAIYRTLRSKALKRVDLAISRLKGQTPIWTFLRPLEILRDELKLCAQDETIELDLTQFWTIDDTFKHRVSQAPGDFASLLDALSSDGERDLVALDRLVNLYNRAQISSVADLDPKDRMFVLIGTYWGDGEREAMYSAEYFNEAYWTIEGAG